MEEPLAEFFSASSQQKWKYVSYKVSFEFNKTKLSDNELISPSHTLLLQGLLKTIHPPHYLVRTLAGG